MGKHTPGPYRIGPPIEAGGCAVLAIREIGLPIAVAHVYNCDGYPDEGSTQANARLIAASPALLAACERAADLLASLGYDTGTTAEECRAAIELARGPA